MVKLIAYTQTKAGQAYAQRRRYPYVCIPCRKSFKYPHSEKPKSCPQCHELMVQLGRKFAAPKRRDAKQWKKIELIVQSGLRFERFYRPIGPNAYVSVNYPAKLTDAKQFLKKYKKFIPSSQYEITAYPALQTHRTRATDPA